MTTLSAGEGSPGDEISVLGNAGVFGGEVEGGADLQPMTGGMAIIDITSIRLAKSLILTFSRIFAVCPACLAKILSVS